MVERKLSLPIPPLAQAVQSVFSVSEELKRTVAGAPIEVDGKTLDLDLQLVIRFAGRGSGVPRPSALSMAFTRLSVKQGASLVAGPELPVSDVDVSLHGAGRPVRAKLFVPGPEFSRADDGLILFIHGGGFATCGIETHTPQMRRLAHSSGCTVLLTEYAKAPEKPWPAGVEDAWAVFRDVAARAEEFGADPTKIMIAGDSAGGNLAAVVARRARDARRRDPQSPVPVAQLLIYPATDLRPIEYKSRRSFGEGFWLTLDQMTAFGELYVPEGFDRANPDLSPLAATDLSDLPPAIVVTSGFDPLHDEGQLYAQALEEAGVPVTYRCYDSLVHGFFAMLAFDGPRRAAIEISELAGEALAG